LDAIVRYRQRHRRLTLSVHFNVHISENRFPILFEPFALKDLQDDTYQYGIASYKQADASVANFLKYLANFIFYRFGLEVNKKSNFHPKLPNIFFSDLLYNNNHCYCCSS
jgi:hypothetical protein